jgi:hypothetical protein
VAQLARSARLSHARPNLPFPPSSLADRPGPPVGTIPYLRLLPCSQPQRPPSVFPASIAPLRLQACHQGALKHRPPPPPINLFCFISIKAPPFIAIKTGRPPWH